MKRVTLRDIARSLDLGVSTVSHALRHEGTIAEKTRHLILERARAMGYQPQPLLASLASKRFRSEKRLHAVPIAYLTLRSSADYKKPNFQPHLPGLRMEAKRLGYRIIPVELSESEPPARLGQRLYRQGVMGIALGLVEYPAHYPWLDFPWDRFCVVACGHHPLSPQVNTIRPSSFRAALHCWRQVHQRGYRRIGSALCQHPEVIPDDEARYGAILYAHEQAGVPLDAPIFRGTHHDHAGLSAWYRQWKPDAVIAFHLGQYWTLRQAGATIPRRVGFACLHALTATFPRASGIDQAVGRVAQQALILLDNMIRHGDRGLRPLPHNVLVGFEWVEGNTLPLRH